MKTKRAFAVFLALVSLTAAWAESPESSTAGIKGWYFGMEVGPALGQCTFRSINEHDSHVGFQGGMFVGYQFNRILSLDYGVTLGGQRQTACDCCPYWLSADGVRTITPMLDTKGWYYSDLTARTFWYRFGRRANIDLLSVIDRGGTRWSLLASPMLTVANTDTELKDADGSKIRPVGWADKSQWHLGLGGQLAVGYRASSHISVHLYGGITNFTGDRFDLIPEHCHKSNLVYDFGIRLTYH